MQGSLIQSFLRNELKDHSGRYFEDVLKCSDGELERSHDYIQWLFPLLVASSSVSGAPKISRDEIEAIKQDALAIRNLIRAKDRMLEFYGRSRHWLVPHDHNHLRITRIIRSLFLLVDRDEAQDFLEAIMDIVVRAGRPVSRKNIGYWLDAADAKPLER